MKGWAKKMIWFCIWNMTMWIDELVYFYTHGEVFVHQNPEGVVLIWLLIFVKMYYH